MITVQNISSPVPGEIVVIDDGEGHGYICLRDSPHLWLRIEQGTYVPINDRIDELEAAYEAYKARALPVESKP